MNSAADATAEKRDSSKRGTIVALVVIFGLIFYLLSPVIVMFKYPMGLPSGPTEEVLRTFFLPLKWLCDHVEIVRSFYEFIFEYVVSPFN